MQLFADGMDRFALVQGEERAFLLSLRDDLGAPIDLTGASVTVDLPKDGGGKVTFRTAAVAITAVDTTDDKLTVAKHGLYDGQRVRLTTTGALPGGLATATDYYVQVVDENTFKLKAAASDASAINLTDAGTGTHSLTTFGLVLTNDERGEVTITIDELASSKLNASIAQMVEFQWEISGVTRIVQRSRMIDVYPQSYP